MAVSNPDLFVIMCWMSLPASKQPSTTDLHPLLPLYLVIFIAFTGYAMMVTLFIPMLAYSDGFFDKSISSSTKVIYGGILLALYPLGQFFGAPVIGSFADKFGRKRVLLISLIFVIFFYAVIAFSLEIKSLWLLMAACFLCGLSESNVAICQSSIADVSTAEDRGTLFAYLYGSESLGYILGPLIGGPLAIHFGYDIPFWVVIVFLVFTYIWIWKSFDDPFVPDKEKEISYFKTFTNLATVFTDLPIRRVYLVNFIIYLSIFGFYRVIQMYMVGEWHFPTDKVTLYYAYLAVVAGIANTFFFKPISRHLSIRQMTIWGSVLGGILMITIVIPKSDSWYWLTAGSSTFLTVIAIAACGSYLSTLVSPKRQGRVLGNNLALQVGAESLSAAMGGILAAILIPLPLILYGALAVLGGLLLITYKGKGDME